MFSCEICETFGNSLFHRASLVAAWLPQKQKVKMKKIYSHEHIHRKTAVKALLEELFGSN